MQKRSFLGAFLKFPLSLLFLFAPATSNYAFKVKIMYFIWFVGIG